MDRVKQAVIDRLQERLPEFVTRSTIAKELKGIMSLGALRNIEQRGHGPKEKTTIGNKTVYSKDSVIAWISNYETVKRRKKR